MKRTGWLVALACAAAFGSGRAAGGGIVLGTLHEDEVHDGCGTELWLRGAPESGPEVFDYLDTGPDDVAHVRVDGELHALHFVGLEPEERWRDKDIEVILRTTAKDTGDPSVDASRLEGTLTIRRGHSTKTWRVRGWLGC